MVRTIEGCAKGLPQRRKTKISDYLTKQSYQELGNSKQRKSNEQRQGNKRSGRNHDIYEELPERLILLNIKCKPENNKQ